MAFFAEFYNSNAMKVSEGMTKLVHEGFPTDAQSREEFLERYFEQYFALVER